MLPGFTPAQVIYTITDLGTLGGPTSAAYAINGPGQITGISTPSGTSTIFHGFRTTPGGLINSPGTDLGTFVGGIGSTANGINASGQVTGDADNAAGASHAFRTTATGRIGDPGTDRGTLGGSNSSGGAINASGQVTGQANLPNDVAAHAFRTTASGRISDPGTDLGVLPGGRRSSGAGINDAGQVVGYSEYALPQPPFLWARRTRFVRLRLA
jgi:probable HAF family extracellular repeat protein